MEAVPGAAESWEVSGDKLTYTFTLRNDGKWSNGDPVTAHDFVYSWKRMLSPDLGALYAYLLHCIENAQAYNEGGLSDFSKVGVEALDDRTLRVKLAHPTPYFLTMQFHQAYYPVHKPTIETFGATTERGTKWTRAGNHVGNGAFRLVEWHPNEHILVEKNPHYWDADNVRLDGIQFFPIDSNQTEERAFRAGELHLTETVPIHKIETYRNNNPEVLRIGPYLGSYFYRFNVTREVFSDKRVRRAFAMAVDREEIASNVLKAGEEPAGCLTPAVAGYTCGAEIPFDVEAAKKLLAEAGYPDGEGFPPVEILYNTSDQHKLIAEAIQRMWKQHLNVDVQLYNQDWKVYLASQNNLDYDIARAGWIADVLDPINFLEMFLTGGGNNRTGWSSEEYDRLINAAYAEAAGERRIALLQQAEALLMEEAPVIPIYYYTQKHLKAPEVKGFVMNLLDYRRWKDFYLAPEAA